MTLSREIRKRIMVGDCPHIGGEGVAPISAGHVWRISKYVAVTVTRVDHRKGKWAARYTVVDRRDLRASADRYLRRVTPGNPEGTTVTDADAIRLAAEQSAYTTRADRAVDPLPVVPADYQAELSKRARPASDLQRERRRQAVAARIGRTLKAADRKGKLTTEHLEAIESIIDALESDAA